MPSPRDPLNTRKLKLFVHVRRHKTCDAGMWKSSFAAEWATGSEAEEWGRETVQDIIGSDKLTAVCCVVAEEEGEKKIPSFRFVPWIVSLCSRLSASSGDPAEGMAPPRGRDCNFLKNHLSSLELELVHSHHHSHPRAPIGKHRTEWKTEAIHAPQPPEKHPRTRPEVE